MVWNSILPCGMYRAGLWMFYSMQNIFQGGKLRFHWTTFFKLFVQTKKNTPLQRVRAITCYSTVNPFSPWVINLQGWKIDSI